MLFIIPVFVGCRRIKIIVVLLILISLCVTLRFLHCHTSKSWPMAEELQDPQLSSGSNHRTHVSELLVNNRETQINYYVTVKDGQ